MSVEKTTLDKTLGVPLDGSTYEVVKRLAESDDRTPAFIGRKLIREAIEARGLTRPLATGNQPISTSDARNPLGSPALA